LSISEPVHNPSNANLNLYPNPTQGECNAAFTLPVSSTKNELEIMDVGGRTLKTIAVPTGAGSLSFSTDNLGRGIYFCVLKAGDVVMDVRKLVVLK
jgi:hypothetical protein